MAREQQIDQDVVDIKQILAHDPQRRLNRVWRNQQHILHLANALANPELQLPITSGMPVGVRYLLLEKLKSGANVVPVFFEN